MPKLSKTVLANTLKLDCDRYLRFRLASEGERKALDLKRYDINRPGPQLMIETGRWWEAGRYEDLIALAPGTVAYRRKADLATDDPEPFDKVENIFDLLREDEPPRFILEGEYEVPSDFLPGVADLLAAHGIDRAHCRPDILWVRKAPTGLDPLTERPNAEYEIHLIDIKMAAEPSMKHFSEVTYYALALDRALEMEGLSDRYAVCSQGCIWPGSYDVHRFRNLVADYRAKGDSDPITAALGETLVTVPHEVYDAHVRHFFEARLPEVLEKEPLDAGWHICQKCHLCDYLGFCRAEAAQGDHLCRIPWLNRGQADLLRQRGIGIGTTRDLAAAIEGQTEPWEAAGRLSPQLRADAPALLARSLALEEGWPHPVPGRVCTTMPRWTHMSVFLTVHFDPGSGIAFAMGASRVYWKRDRQKGEPPVKDERVFIVDRAEDLNPSTERKRLVELVQTIHDWVMEADRENRGLKEKDRIKVQIYLWDGLEVRQLRRMLERHMDHEDVVEAVELLVRLFPPETELPDWEAYKSQPYTVVKDVFRQIVGLPLPHDYTLFDAVDTYYPDLKADSTPWRTRRAYGFFTELNDQIPFERGYELWKDHVNLRHVDRSDPDNPTPGREFTRGEVYDGIKDAVKLRLKALEKAVERLRTYQGKQLRLTKGGFRAGKPSQANIPTPARRLIAFEKLNAVVSELENRQQRALPLEEREARFLCIRGLLPAGGDEADAAIAAVREARPEETHDKTLYAFTFSPDSRDARVKEGDFLLALTNEDTPYDLDKPLFRQPGWDFDTDRQRVQFASIGVDALLRKPLRQVVAVTVFHLNTAADPPFLVLAPNNTDLFHFARTALEDRPPLLDFERPMVIDILHADFFTKHIEAVLREVGGKPGAFEALPSSNGRKA